MLQVHHANWVKVGCSGSQFWTVMCTLQFAEHVSNAAVDTLLGSLRGCKPVGLIALAVNAFLPTLGYCQGWPWPQLLRCITCFAPWYLQQHDILSHSWGGCQGQVHLNWHLLQEYERISCCGRYHGARHVMHLVWEWDLVKAIGKSCMSWLVKMIMHVLSTSSP